MSKKVVVRPTTTTTTLPETVSVSLSLSLSHTHPLIVPTRRSEGTRQQMYNRETGLHTTKHSFGRSRVVDDRCRAVMVLYFKTTVRAATSKRTKSPSLRDVRSKGWIVRTGRLAEYKVFREVNSFVQTSNAPDCQRVIFFTNRAVGLRMRIVRKLVALRSCKCNVILWCRYSCRERNKTTLKKSRGGNKYHVSIIISRSNAFRVSTFTSTETVIDASVSLL